ncbi:Glutathione gamma-glutamylcysteinyltransferase 1 [Asimina triloba]
MVVSMFMLISRLHRPPSLLYTLSCKDESWVSTAKYLIEDVPRLLTSEDVNSVQNVLTVLFGSLPANIEEFIKWVAEVRRQEEGGSSLSQEEKARLAAKEELLKQVHEIHLFKHVTEWLLSARPCCRNISSLTDGDTLPEIACKVCCQGAELLGGKAGAATMSCCKATCVRCLKANGDPPKTVVSGTVVTNGSKQEVDVLVPLSASTGNSCGSGLGCIAGRHPASNDVLSVLLLALPSETWSGIREEKLLLEIQHLVSTENLPVMLQEEVLHLRRQLHFLKRCKDNEADEDIVRSLIRFHILSVIPCGATTAMCL